MCVCVWENMEGKSVIVTGGSKGLGKGIAKVFARAGAKVLVVSRTLKEAEQTATEITNEGYIASSASADISDEKQVNDMAALAAERYGGIDVLCANAGIYPSSKIEAMDVKEWDSVVNVVVFFLFFKCYICFFITPMYLPIHVYTGIYSTG